MTITEEAIRFIWGQVDKLFVRKADIQQEVNSSTNPVSSVAVKTIVDKLSGTPIVPKGSIEFSNLPTLTDASIGDLYNIKDNFTTTDDFIEGAGVKISAGTNVVCVEENLTKKWDCFGTNFEVDSEPVQNSNNPISSNAVYNLKQIVDGLSGGAAITHKGVVDSVDNLPTLTECEIGDIYTITTAYYDSDGIAGYTTDTFVEGARQLFPQNARVICVEKDGEKKWTRIDTSPDPVDYVDKYTASAPPTGRAVMEEITKLEEKIGDVKTIPIYSNISAGTKTYNLTDFGYYPNLTISGDQGVDVPYGAKEAGYASMFVFEVDDRIDSEFTGGRSFIYQFLFWDYDSDKYATPNYKLPDADRVFAYRRLIKPKTGSITPTDWITVGEKARQLTTARNIAGTAFDGTKDIDISYNNLTDKPDIPTVSNDLTNELKATYDAAAEKAHTHTNKNVLDGTEEAFTTELKEKIQSVDDKLALTGGTMLGTITSQAATFFTSVVNKYKVFLRNDGTHFYILQSNEGGESWDNAKRPFTIDLSTGEGSINGAAAKLSTPRTIAGASFDGTANIDISYNNLTDKPAIPTVSNDLTDELKTKYDAAAANSHIHSNKEILDETTAAFTEELKVKVETPYLPKAGGTMTGTILSQANNCLVSQFGDYKVFFRNNGTDRFYVLLSDKGGDTWNNDKHPFTINLETGEGYINGSAATLKDSGWIDMEVNSDFVSSGTIKYRTYGKQLMIYGENVVLAQDLKISPSVPQMLASTTNIDFSNIKCCSGFGRTAGGKGAHIHALQYSDGTNMVSAEAVATACPAGENLYFTITGLID